MLRLSLGAGFSRVGFDAYVASLPIALLAAGWTDGAIGALMGVAALTQLPTSFIGGGLLDRFGGRLLFLAGAGSFAVASLLVATGIASPDGPPVVMVIVRVFQGMGIAVLMPAALSLVPNMVAAASLPTAFAVVGPGGQRVAGHRASGLPPRPGPVVHPGRGRRGAGLAGDRRLDGLAHRTGRPGAPRGRPGRHARRVGARPHLSTGLAIGMVAAAGRLVPVRRPLGRR